MSIRIKGRDQIEFGYKDYVEASYGASPGAVPTALFRVGHMMEISPLMDPENKLIWSLRDAATHAALAILSKKESVGLRIQWLQGTLGQYLQEVFLSDHKNCFGEAKMYRAAGDALYLYWTGLKANVLSVRCSVGEEMLWTCDMIGKLYDSKLTTIHTYGAAVGDPWEWDDTYMRVSENDADWSVIPDVTDYEFIIDNQLKSNFIFNDASSKQLSTLEEMEQISTVKLTMNLKDELVWLDYLNNQTEIYVRLEMPDGKYLKLNKAKVYYMDPVIKPEDLVACRVEIKGRWMTTNFT